MSQSTRREFAATLTVAAGALVFGRSAWAQSAKPLRIDVHSHSVPPIWLEFLKSQRQPAPRTVWNLNKHIADMDRGGVTTSILSLGSPGVWHGSDLTKIRTITRQVNEYNAKLSADYPGRFGQFATLPLMDIEGSVKEAIYALDELKADGICMRTPYGEILQGDPIFSPLYDELNRRKAVIFVHPQDAPCCRSLVPGVESQATLEYGQYTTRAIISLVVNGMAARYPDIQWIFSHAGGTMPFLVSRVIGRKMSEGADGTIALDPTDKARGEDGPARLAQLRRFYYEVAQQTNPVALGALRKVVPISQILFGTDYPASDSFGLAEPMADHAAGLAGVFKGAELAAVESGNALRLFPRYRK